MTVEVVDRIGLWGIGWIVAISLIILAFVAMRDG